MFEIEQWPFLRNDLKEQQAKASGSSGLSARASGSSGRPTIPSRSLGRPTIPSRSLGLPAEAYSSSAEQLSSSEKKADSSSDDEIRKHSKIKVYKTYQIILCGYPFNIQISLTSVL